MAECQVCGNDYDNAFEVVHEGHRYTFDCFECAIHALAPVCARCNVRVIGHGVQASGDVYCCRHCAEKAGVHGIQDRV